MSGFLTKDTIAFGKELKEKHFLIAAGYINLNHGSFGAIPKPVLDYQLKFVLEQGNESSSNICKILSKCGIE